MVHQTVLCRRRLFRRYCSTPGRRRHAPGRQRLAQRQLCARHSHRARHLRRVRAPASKRRARCANHPCRSH
uniref:Uncharacterized protein n=1 Tax=Arundo donax TaxID=35708 RepID=A0A0A8Y0W6_ARUDO